MNKLWACENCFELQRRVDHLEEELTREKQKTARLEKKNKEGYFGASTPSSKVPIKPSSLVENQKKKGGRKKGHIGSGRSSVDENTADRVEQLQAPEFCPDCGNKLKNSQVQDRTVIESEPIKVEKILYKCECSWCSVCKKYIKTKPDVFDNGLYGNQLVAQAISMHYGQGMSMGQIGQMLGEYVKVDSLYSIFHRMANIWENTVDKLILEYRSAPVKHADETGWREDGQSGYAWLFCNPYVSIFKFETTRAATIPEIVFGTTKIPGTLVVDRYNGYNHVPCYIQYCYAHLLRDVKNLGKEAPENEEIKNFVEQFGKLLSDAIKLRSKPITNKAYYKEAKKIKRKMKKIIKNPATDIGIQNIQYIFKKNEKRLYKWVDDRRIPAENNFAERELRPTVIARKMSFGTQSEKGSKTRSTLMSILETAKKRLRGQTLEGWLKQSLDKLARDPNLNPYLLLPSVPP